MEVQVAIADARPIDEERVVEQRAIAVGRRLQFLQEIRELPDVMGVDLGQHREVFGVVLVMGVAVVPTRYADLGERPAADFFAEHERADACQVGLIGQRQQVEHQPAVLLECVWNADWLFHDRHLAVTLLLGFLDTPLDVSDRIEILRELVLVASPKRSPEPVRFTGHKVEDAPVLADTCESRPHVGAICGAKQPLEHCTGVVFHRQRCRRRAPRDRVGVGTAVPLVACAQHFDRVDRELE